MENKGFFYMKSWVEKVSAVTLFAILVYPTSGISLEGDIFKEVNPGDGYGIGIAYRDIGPKLVAEGVIDLEKMISLYKRKGTPLTSMQIGILSRGSTQEIRITRDNASFLLNLLWALGLANKNPILDKGPMVRKGRAKIGRFASTGGWRLGRVKAEKLYSRIRIIPLDTQKQAVLEDFAYHSYRPCCSNPTAFPDCNHGMAALGLGEILASQGASAEEIFDALKYFNAFWFPQHYFDLALYFRAKEQKDWHQVDGREVVGARYSSARSIKEVKKWLKRHGVLNKVPYKRKGCRI